VQHVFLVGRHDPKKFAHFIDDLLTEFSFKTIQFIQNEAGVIFKYKDRILLGNPDYLMVMRYRICSNFPLHEIIAYHKDKEEKLGCSSTDRDEESSGGNSKALVTVMTARLDHLQQGVTDGS
jgi:mannose-1-phosphate guanylyltransferase